MVFQWQHALEALDGDKASWSLDRIVAESVVFCSQMHWASHLSSSCFCDNRKIYTFNILDYIMHISVGSFSHVKIIM